MSWARGRTIKCDWLARTVVTVRDAVFSVHSMDGERLKPGDSELNLEGWAPWGTCLPLRRLHRDVFHGLCCCCGWSIFLFLSICICSWSLRSCRFQPRPLVWCGKIIVYLALLGHMIFGREMNFLIRPTNGLFYSMLLDHSCISHIYSKSAPLFAMVCRSIWSN